MEKILKFDCPEDNELFRQCEFGPMFWDVLKKQRKLLFDYEKIDKANKDAIVVLNALFDQTDKWLLEYGIKMEQVFPDVGKSQTDFSFQQSDENGVNGEN